MDKKKIIQDLIASATKSFVKDQGRPPNNLENILLKQKAINAYLEKQKVVDFPQDKITPFYEERPTAGIMQASKIQRPGKVIDNERTKKMFDDANKRLMDRQGYRVIPADTPEGRNISKKLGIMTEETNPRFLDYTIQNMMKMDPVDAMKEANKIIKREGPYDSLSKEEAKKILDATEDYIFQRNKTTFSPEDYKPTSNPSKKEIRKLENQLGNLDPNASGFRERANELISKIENLKNNLRASSRKEEKGIAGTGAIRQAYDEAIKKGTFKGTYDEFLNYIDDLVDNDFAVGGRVGFKKGTDLLRREFLKALGAGAATIGAAKTGILKFGAEKKVAKELVTTPPVAGKPPWFDKLVNRVILEGDDVTKNLAYKDRQTVHKAKINETDEVTVYQNLDDGQIDVIYDSPTNMGEESVNMTFKPGMADETTKGKKPPDEFTATEVEPQYVGGPEDSDIEFVGEGGGSDIRMLESDITPLKKFAGEKVTMKETLDSIKRNKSVEKINNDMMEQAEYIAGKYGDGPEPPDDYPFASGGIARMLGE